MTRSEYVTVLPTGKVIVVFSSLEATDLDVTVAPPAVAIDVIVKPDRPDGKVSLSVAPVAAFGPRLTTVTVKEVVCPSKMMVGDARFVIERSA